MFQISWAIAICPVHEFMALDVFFSLGEHETNCLVKSWSSWGLWEPDMLPVANGGQCKGIFRMGRRLFALMKNIKHKYIYIYDTICTPGPSQQLCTITGYFQPLEVFLMQSRWKHETGRNGGFGTQGKRMEKYVNTSSLRNKSWTVQRIPEGCKS